MTRLKLMHCVWSQKLPFDACFLQNFACEMNTMNIYTIKQLTSKFRDGSLTPLSHVKNELKKLQKLLSDHPEINPIVEIFPIDDILKQAKESTIRYSNNQTLGEFDGIPYTIKDSILCDIKNKMTEMGSNISHLDDSKEGGLFGIPEQTSPQITMLLESGAIPICITTCPELGHKGLTTSYLRGITRNPHDQTLSTGGSSGGSAALVALNICGNISIGTDGGGSIRIPAGWCGVYGFKPSYNIGCCNHPISPYIGVAGPLSLNIDDIRLYLKKLYQQPNDYAVIPNNIDFSEEYMKSGIGDLKIAVSKNYDGIIDYVDTRIWSEILRVIEYLQEYHNADITFIEPPLRQINDMFEGFDYYKCWKYLWFSFMGILYDEYIQKYPDLKYSVDPGLIEIIERSKNMTMKDLVIANQVRDAVIDIMTQFHKKYDLLISPITPILPLKAMSYLQDMYMMDMNTKKKITWFDCYHSNAIFTCLCNLTYQPAMNVNMGFVKTKYGKAPIGMHIIGRNNKDNVILKLAYCVQQKFKPLVAKL